MRDLVLEGSAIEGNAVLGECRDTLIARGRVLSRDGQPCYGFTANFNVKSRIESPLVLGKDGKPLDSSASTSLNDKIVCDNAIIHSVKKKYNQAVASNVSSTHSSQPWNFPNQTAVRIIRSHDQILNGIKKREEQQKAIEHDKARERNH
jgi:hypothetical protein